MDFSKKHSFLLCASQAPAGFQHTALLENQLARSNGMKEAPRHNGTFWHAPPYRHTQAAATDYSPPRPLKRSTFFKRANSCPISVCAKVRCLLSITCF